MADSEETFRTLNNIIHSMRLTNDRHITRDPLSFDLIRSLAMKIEGLRFLVMSARRNNEANHEISFQRIIYEAYDILNDDLFIKYYAGRRFRYLTAERTRSPHPNAVALDGSTMDEALRSFITIAESANIQTTLELERSTFPETTRLRELVPEQKVAPIQFQIIEGRLTILHRSATAGSRDADAAASARTALIDNGRKIIENLKQSNCDKRLLDVVESLQSKLECNNDIIQLGIENIGCDMLRSAFEPELPDAIVAMLRARTISVGLYVAQFPEWSQFAANAADVELNSDDVEKIFQISSKIISEL